jgi:phosphatidylglycerol lysyltransferase
LLAERFGVGWTIAALIVLTGSLWLGLFAHKHVEYSSEMWWSFAFHGDASRFLRASVGAIALAVFLSLARLLRPASFKNAGSTEQQLQTIEPIVRASPHAEANLALLGDKTLLVNDDQSAFIMYGVHGRTWVALGDPVGPVEAWPELAWSFRELGDRFHARTVFYQVEPDQLSLYVELGLSLLKIGEEARVLLEAFSLDGSAMKSLRHGHRRLAKEGCEFSIVDAPRVAAVLPEVRRVSDAWLADKNVREKGFSLGYFDDQYLQRFPMAVARRDGEAVAFANILTTSGREELSCDLMRYAPTARSGVMEWLLIELMLWGKAQGYRWFNLGMAPLAGLESNALAPRWNRAGALFYRHGEHFYNFQGLRAYKEKFAPAWQSRYLATPRGYALPLILTDIAALISRGVVGLVAK